MHVPIAVEKDQENQLEESGLDFAWLELTNRCNLSCSHCYAESGPDVDTRGELTEEEHLRVISELYALGCRKIQFIGGEPTLNKSLHNLIEFASAKGFTFIEVFTNLTRLPTPLFELLRKHKVAVATSFYSHRSEVHDQITNSQGSFFRTVQNIKRILAAGLQLRAGIILMDENRDDFEATKDFLNDLGVKEIGSDSIRGIGRASCADSKGMEELCGSCAGNILTVGPDGVVAPCNMSKQWAVGNVRTSDLAEIVRSDKLVSVRQNIGAVVEKRLQREGQTQAMCFPDRCGPNCAPSTRCYPTTGPCYPLQGCAPNPCLPRC